MRQHRIEMVLEAREPISHSESTIGNTQVVARRKVVMPNGRMARVPIVSGDTIRHGLREAASYALLEAAGMLDARCLSEAALRFLFNGGMVGGAPKDTVRMEEERRMRELLPHLPLLGGCVGNRIVPGKVECGEALLVCDETMAMMPGWVVDWMTSSGRESVASREHIEIVQRVRMDSSLDPKKRLLLTDGARDAVERRLLASEAAAESGDERAQLAAKSTMMPYTYEAIARGSIFFWRLDAVTHTQLEHDTMYVMLAAFLSRARVGGKKGTGHGLLAPVAARGMQRELAISQPALDALTVSSSSVAQEAERYRAHVASRAAEVREVLESIVA